MPVCAVPEYRPKSAVRICRLLRVHPKCEQKSWSNVKSDEVLHTASAFAGVEGGRAVTVPKHEPRSPKLQIQKAK